MPKLWKPHIIMKKINQLKKDLKQTLNNNVCNVQSLDVIADRNRVLKELLKTLTTKYIWQKIPKQKQEK